MGVISGADVLGQTENTPTLTLPRGTGRGDRNSATMQRNSLESPPPRPEVRYDRSMPSDLKIMPFDLHDRVVTAAYRLRGYTESESTDAARFCRSAAEHGIRTHNAIKAIHLDDYLGSKTGGCIPGATVEVLPTQYPAVQRWNANRKLGMSVAYAAMESCMAMADQFGVGIVAVDNAFHYLWGGGYVIDAARRGYLAYTNCTAALSEVVPFGGVFPTLGTNPHSWAFPTTDAVGFPICVDWATSTVAMGRVQQYARENRLLPPGTAVDASGAETTDPSAVAALLPFGGHKGYGLALVDELTAAFIGGSLPTLRSRPAADGAGGKHSCCFYFQCVKPDALDCGDFAAGRSQMQNVAAVIADVLGHGNDRCKLPGQPEAEAAAATSRAGGLLFTPAEIEALAKIADEAGEPFDPAGLDRIAD